MKYTITTNDPMGAVGLSAKTDYEAVMKARALIDAGAEAVSIRDKDGRPVDLDDLAARVERAWRDDLGI